MVLSVSKLVKKKKSSPRKAQALKVKLQPFHTVHVGGACFLGRLEV